jgi:zinc transport system substrate-binding protein
VKKSKNNMKNFMPLGILLIGLLLISGQNSDNYLETQNVASNAMHNPPKAAQTTLKIMTTNTIPYDIVSNVVGSADAVESIVSGETDVHSFQGPTQQQLNALSQADVLFAMGLEGLEPWLADTLTSLGGNAPPVVNLVNSAMIRNDPVLDNGPNPHVWLDPNVVKQMVDIIYTDLSTRDAANAATFDANRNAYKTALDELLGRITNAKSTLKDVKVVTIHPAFTYLFDLLEMDQIATLEKVEGQEPSNQYYQEVVNLMKDEGCKLVVGQPQIPEEEAFELARDANAKVAFPSPFPFVPDQNGEIINTYIAMMDYNLWALTNPEDPPGEIPGYGLSLIALTSLIGLLVLIKRNRT